MCAWKVMSKCVWLLTQRKLFQTKTNNWMIVLKEIGNWLETGLHLYNQFSVLIDTIIQTDLIKNKNVCDVTKVIWIEFMIIFFKSIYTPKYKFYY